MLRHSLDISRTSPSHDLNQERNYKLQINELQSMNKMGRERNKMLERQVEELSQQLGNMNKVNRKLIGSNGVIDGRDVEQVYTASYKKELTEAYKQIEFLQFETDKLRRVNQMLLEENANLQSKVHQYRKYVVQLSSTQEIPMAVLKTIEVPLVIYKSITDPYKFSNIISVFDHIYAAVTEFSQRNTIYVCSPTLQRLYLAGLGKPLDKTRIGKMFVFIHSPPKNEKALFSSLEQVNSSKFAKDYLLIPGIFHKEIGFVLQCCDPNLQSFTENDEKVANFLINSACKEIKVLISKTNENCLKERIEGILQLISVLVTANSLDKFANLVDSELAKFCGFEAAGVVFVDNLSKEFFIFGYSSKPGVKFGNEVIRLPLNMGITGDNYQFGELKIYQNIKQKALYSPEIDNVAAVGDIRSCVMVGLSGPEGKFTGVLQIVNKISGKITANDCKVIEELSKVLGYMIYGIAAIEQSLDLTTRMKASLSTILLHNK